MLLCWSSPISGLRAVSKLVNKRGNNSSCAASSCLTRCLSYINVFSYILHTLRLHTFGASKQAGQFSGITGNCDYSTTTKILMICKFTDLTSVANWRRSFSLTYTNGRMTLRSPSLGEQTLNSLIAQENYKFLLNCIAGLHGTQAAIMKN